MPIDRPQGRPSPDIVPRRPALRAGGRGDAAWLGGDVAKTALWSAFSTILPTGERFFVRSVRHYRHEVRDPKLAKDVEGFLTQEGLHHSVHQEFNVELERQGHDLTALQAPAITVLDWLVQARPHHHHLAVTCALEHFTAIMADILLRTPELLRDADRDWANLWYWHALEELEHKGVAFDVWNVAMRQRSATTRYVLRCKIFLETTLIFNGLFFLALRRLIMSFPWRRRMALWAKISWYLWGTPGIYRRLIPQYVAYLRPGFHPWDDNNAELLRQWRDAIPVVAVTAAE